MKISINEDNIIQLEEVYNSIILKTRDGEEMYICMRDSGFEFKYQGKWYFAQEGKVSPLSEDTLCELYEFGRAKSPCEKQCDSCKSFSTNFLCV